LALWREGSVADSDNREQAPVEQSVATVDLQIFKYMQPRWADALSTGGAIRIGTLFDYRRDEHIAAVADDGEGRDPLYLPYDGVLADNPADRPAVVRAVFGDNVGGGAVFDRCVFEAERSSDNCYVLSVGLEFSERMLAEFGGACVRIRSFSKFAGLLTKAIWKHHRGGIVDHAFAMCAYREKGRPYSDHDFKIHPALIKNKEYEWQNEARVLWRMQDASALEPLYLKLPRLAKHCTRIR
jgi:hypothetical protein